MASAIRTKATSDVVPQVYSYGRCSDIGQLKGTTKLRQSDKAARDYAKRSGLPFNESLNMFDAGKSAFTAEHLRSGILGKFLHLCRLGRIAPGSRVVLDDIDRLGRQEPIDHLEVFIEFVNKHGISFYTPIDDCLYDRSSVNSGLIWKLIAKIQTAHEESLKKSNRSKANWKFKREQIRNDGKVTVKVPDWFQRIEVVQGDGTTKRQLVRDKYGKPVPLNVAQKSIIEVYRQFDKNLGETVISNYLLKHAPWKRSWNKQYVRNLLCHPVTSRQVIGEVTLKGDSEPIQLYANLFKNHMDLYERVQAKLRKRVSRGGGRNGKQTNLFQKFVFCGYCGKAMHFHDRGKQYLVCYGGCKPPMPYQLVESLILNNVPWLRPDHVMPSKSDEAKQCELLHQRVEATRAKLETTERKIKNLIEAAEDEPNKVQRNELLKRARERRAEVAQLKEQVEAEQHELDSMENGQRAFKTWQATMPALIEQLQDGTNIELRQRMRGHLAELIERVELFGRGHSAEWDDETQDGDSFYGEWCGMMESNPSKHDAAFIEFVMARRMTKAGRFVRIVWKNGNRIDLVPPGSIASGHSLTRSDGPPSITFTRPDLEQLRKQFTRKPRKPR